jgi:hypothetical protein
MKKENLPASIDSVEDELKVVLQNRKDDYEYARDLLYTTAEKLQDILDAAVVMAQESEHPRAVEVAVGAATALADTAGRMMDHHIKTEKVNNPQGNKTPTEVTNNTLNVKLNSKDLLELLSRE